MPKEIKQWYMSSEPNCKRVVLIGNEGTPRFQIGYGYLEALEPGYSTTDDQTKAEEIFDKLWRAEFNKITS